MESEYCMTSSTPLHQPLAVSVSPDYLEACGLDQIQIDFRLGVWNERRLRSESLPMLVLKCNIRAEH